MTTIERMCWFQRLIRFHFYIEFFGLVGGGRERKLSVNVKKQRLYQKLMSLGHKMMRDGK